jgi:hypothetical protein
MHLSKSLIFLTCQTILSFLYICIGNAFYTLYFFFTLPPSLRDAHLCELEVGFSQVAKNCQVLRQTVGGGVFSVFAKNYECQSDFAKYWRCSIEEMWRVNQVIN